MASYFYTTDRINTFFKLIRSINYYSKYSQEKDCLEHFLLILINILFFYIPITSYK